jgi:beta-aspartyl-dipeptidase (metallo-type)
METCYLIKNIESYNPLSLGQKDILIGGTKILAIENEISLPESLPGIRIIDGQDYVAVPGVIDCHVHIIGGGGEGGYTSRTPELHLTDFTLAGVTTVVGTLGTDAVTRTMSNLIAKVKALKEEGISAFCYSGNYRLPLKSLTGSIMDDLLLVEEIIGAGEIALSDHRSSQPDFQELVRVTADTRVGGMLSRKAGIINIHLGDGKRGLSMLRELVKQTEIPATQFLPTHMTRNPGLFREGLEWAKSGGFIDFTSCTTEQFLAEGELRASEALRIALEDQVPLERISFSSDAGGSLPQFDEGGNLIGIEIGKSTSQLDEFRRAVFDQKVDISSALHPITKNPARILKLAEKGELRPGSDADLLLLDKQSLELSHCFSLGTLMVEKGQALVHGAFEGN